MTNPFEIIDARLSNIENLILDIKHGNIKSVTLQERRSTGMKKGEAFCRKFNKQTGDAIIMPTINTAFFAGYLEALRDLGYAV